MVFVYHDHVPIILKIVLYMMVLIYGSLFQTSLERANPFRIFTRKLLLPFFNRNEILTL
jgi:hypothetical protein